MSITRPYASQINVKRGTATRTLDDTLADSISVRDYGAVGDGTTDDSAAIQAAFDAAEADSSIRSVYFPSGNYYMASLATMSLPNETSANGFTIYGAGPYVSKIIQAEANSTGALKVIINGNQETVTVRDLSIHSTLVLADGIDNGVALYIASSVEEDDVGFGARDSMSCLIENVFIEGDGINSAVQASAGVWDQCIKIDFLWYPVLRNVNVFNHNTATGSSGFSLLDCYDPRFFDCYVRGAANRGIHINTRRAAGLPSFEGGMVVNCNVVGPLDGLVVNHDSAAPALYEPGFHVIGGHWNCQRHSMRFNYHRQIVVSGAYCYLRQGSAADADLLPSGIYMERASDWVVTGCQFLEPGYYTSDSNCSVGVRIGASSNGGLVDACVFNTGGIGVRSAATGINRVGTNNIYSLGQRTGAWASFTRTFDTVGTLINGAAGTGWSDPTGTADRAAFDTAAVTLPELAERVKALVDDLKTKGVLED